MYTLFTTGVALWVAYGALMASGPLLAANVVTLSLALAILVMKLRYGRSPRKG
jgi:MtN3 and saliva related transmembrane protein